jgi:bacterioferritin-associated ferredoxin
MRPALLIVGDGPLGLAARDEARIIGLDATLVATDDLVMVEADGAVLLRAGAGLALCHPARLLLAPEPVPRRLAFPGWTLPGVSALAEAAPRPGESVWIAAAAARLAEAAAVWPQAGRLDLGEIEDLRAEGTDRLVAIAWRRDGGTHRVAADRLVVHDGTVPDVQQTRALGCVHRWDTRQSCWVVVTDATGATSRPGVSVAGESAHAARAAVRDAAGIGCGPETTADPPAHAPPPPLSLLPADPTIVCRCEGVTAGAIRDAARLGCPGLNQLKAFTRCGMGPCQGRDCCALAAEVLAQARGVLTETIAPMRVRFPLVPVTLGALAALA